MLSMYDRLFCLQEVQGINKTEHHINLEMCIYV